jgi:serine/threonine protein phosphatase PrpC
MKILQLYYGEERIKLPKEDAWAIDEKRGVFAVADGVHLRKGIEYEGSGEEYKTAKYPTPSPAGKLAQEFCDNFLTLARSKNIKQAFASANKSVFRLNKTRDKYGTLSNAETYYAATGAFGRITKNVLEWGNICDASVSVIDEKGNFKLRQTDHRHYNEFDPILEKYSSLDQSYMLRTIFRNALSPRGKKLGYGVITGEPTAEVYVHYGKQKLQRGDVIVFATDGFEEFLKDISFRKAILTMNRDVIEDAVDKIQKKHRRTPEFVSERTLIAIKTDSK